MSDEFTFDDALDLNPRLSNKPKLVLVGRDGNAFSILGAANRSLKRAGYSKEKIQEYLDEATSGDYDNLLAVTMKWFDVS